MTYSPEKAIDDLFAIFNRKMGGPGMFSDDMPEDQRRALMDIIHRVVRIENIACAKVVRETLKGVRESGTDQDAAEVLEDILSDIEDRRDFFGLKE